MGNPQAAPPTLRRRVVRLSLVSLLMGIFFTLGATVTAVVAARAFLPMAAAGMTMGLVGLASSSATATMNALHTGDSEPRKAALTGLKQSFTSAGPIDPQLAALILPALDQCMTDEDPEVVALAKEVKIIVQDNTFQPD